MLAQTKMTKTFLIILLIIRAELLEEGNVDWQVEVYIKSLHKLLCILRSGICIKTHRCPLAEICLKVVLKPLVFWPKDSPNSTPCRGPTAGQRVKPGLLEVKQCPITLAQSLLPFQCHVRNSVKLLSKDGEKQILW